MQHRRSASLPVVLGLAVGGVVLGHWLGYVAALQDAAVRGRLLAHTGHSWLHLGKQLALLAPLLGASWRLLSSAAGRRRTGSPSWARLALVLGALQVGSFIAVEISERIAAGVPLATLLEDHLLIIGVLVQLAVALVGAHLLRWVFRVTDRLCDWLAVPRTVFGPMPPTPPPAAARVASPRLDVLRGGMSLRGPPSAISF